MTEGGDLLVEARGLLDHVWPGLSDDEKIALVEMFTLMRDGGGPSTKAEGWAWFWARVADLRQRRGAYTL